MSDERALEQARAVWRAAMDRDEAFAAPARQRRLLQAPLPRPRPTLELAAAKPPTLEFAAAKPPTSAGVVPLHAAVALAVIAYVAWIRGAPPVAAPASDATEPAASSPPAVASAADAPPFPAPATAQHRPLVALAPCFGCKRAGSDASSVGAGERLVPGERVQVPRGSTLILCFGVEGDEASRVTVSGPATIVVKSTGAVAVERDDPPTVQSALARSRPAAGDPLALWHEAQDALGAGDRATAERRLRALLGMAGVSDRLRERASFALAEVELARGAKDDACARLESLLTSADASLGADAAFLEARAAETPGARVAVIARYLAGDPPSPYRERAVVDQGLALFEAGDLAGARARAAALRASGPLPDVVSVALERLESELRARSVAP
jgi:hypothetical protein